MLRNLRYVSNITINTLYTLYILYIQGYQDWVGYKSGEINVYVAVATV